MDSKTCTITLTFGECSENHRGMQQIGKIGDKGFSIDELKKIKEKFEEKEIKCELIELNESLNGIEAEPAAILIIRKGCDFILEDQKADDLFKEQSVLDVDKKAFMYGRVVNKKARYNLCFDHSSQEPDYAQKKGRIIAFKDVPLLDKLRIRLPELLGDKAGNLTAEGNYYHDLKKCGISFHGDTERKIVIAIRLGCSLPLHYQWYYQCKPVGDRAKLMLNHGDIYIMSEKAVGSDWRKRSILTLRHAAGAAKFLK